MPITRQSFLRLCLALAAAVLTPLATPAHAPAAEPLNFIVIVTDDQSWGSEEWMPFVYQRPDWLRFENAFVHFPKCCPSRATILTGLYSHNNGIENNRSGGQFGERPTVASALQDAGYRTALIGKYMNEYPFGFGASYVPPGWDQWYALADSGRYYRYTLFENGTAVSYGSRPSDYITDVLARKAEGFIQQSQNEPFFLYFAPNAPHEPHVPADRHLDEFGSTPVTVPPNFNEEDVSDKPEWVQALEFRSKTAMEESRRREREQLLAVDDAIRRMFKTLEAAGILDRTVVVFTSDNGFAFGEHRWRGKKCGYEECLRVPFYVRGPGVLGGLRTELVTNTDIAPTILQLAGLSPRTTDGLSLVPLLTGSTEGWRDAVLIRSLGRANGISLDFWGLRTGRYKYMELGTGERELYDLQADPYELENLAPNPAFDEIEADLAARLAELRP
ncbi:MAG TPA: sulfatase [Actinomycetota bacterium]|nr:sulfatase [Actinomycetota bacterium]